MSPFIDMEMKNEGGEQVTFLKLGIHSKDLNPGL